jgi:hypothetical protein
VVPENAVALEILEKQAYRIRFGKFSKGLSWPNPEPVLKKSSDFKENLSASHLVCRFSVPGIPREACKRSLDLFTREVMPALRNATC